MGSPVWHMPEGLVLIVNAVRILLRTVAFLVRNIVPVTVLSGLAWLGYRIGWTAPVIVLSLVVLVLSVWALVDNPSFVRWVARPARARWRLVMVYRRDWQPVLVTAGLTKVHKGREYLPSLVRVRCGPTSDRVLVKMLKGQAPDAWEQVAVNLAHGFGATLVRVRDGDRPGRIWLEFVRRDALAVPIPALPIPDPADVDLSGLEIGRQEDGSPWRLRLLGTHVLIAGATGAARARSSGRSSALCCLGCCPGWWRCGASTPSAWN